MEREKLIKIIEKRARLGYQRPEPLFLSRSVILEFAENMSRKYRSKHSVGLAINPYELVEHLHGNIHFANADCREAIYVHGKSNFDIILPFFTSTMSDRFTITQKIGHYFLHSYAGEQKIYSEGIVSPIAKMEANWFAAGFLLPQYLLKQSGAINISRMVELFGVSSSVANLRFGML